MSTAEGKRKSARKPPGKMPRREFEQELRKLQVELCHLQAWVKETGERAIVVFEGRDAAGKGGVIKRIIERVSPRVFRVAALPAPTEREKTQMYIQRYMRHFPAAGEVVIFDRSWYNRAGVERVMGFCTQAEYERFLDICPSYEREIVHDGVRLIKYWLQVSPKEQRRRFQARLTDPMRQWKLSPMDVASLSRWWDYTAATQRMLEATDTDHAPWYCVPSDDKRRARLNCIAHLLSRFPYERVPIDPPALPKRQKRPAGVPETPNFKNVVAAVY